MYSFIFKTSRSQSITIILYCFFYSVFAAASVSILMPFVNFIFSDYNPIVNIPLFSFLQSDKKTWLIVLCLTTWFVFLLKNLFFVAAQLRTSRMKNDLLQQLREDYLQRILGQSLDYFHSTPAGYINTRIFDVTRQFAEKLSVSFYDISRSIPLILLYSAILIFISWKLMALSLVLVPLLSLAGNQFHKILQKSISEEQHVLGRLVQHIQQKIYGIKLIKLFHSEKFELEKFRQQNAELKRVFLFRDRMESAGISVVEMIGVSAGVLLLYVIGSETLEGRFNYGPGGFVLFIAAVFSLIDPVKNLIRSIHTVKEADVLWKTLHQLKITEKVRSVPSRTIEHFEHQIEFSNVAFHFDNHPAPLFENLNLKINKGEKIVLAGKSGIGKSTLIDLMLGLYQPSSGTVTLDGIPVSEIHRKSLSNIFGVVTQEAFLFHDSIRNNIAYNVNVLSDEEIIEAIKKVQLFDWFVQQPQGLNTVIGDRGQTMSGGEKQRLVLARLILRNPDVLIFDEATSALDIPSEKALHETVFRIFSDKTMLFISHRHTIYPFADRIVEIKRRSTTERTLSSTFA